MSQRPPFPSSSPTVRYEAADARDPPVDDDSIDVIITSPPYWQQRDYDIDGQLGHESTPEAFADTIAACLDAWVSCLAPHGSVLLNVDDTYVDKSLQGIPAAIIERARSDGWTLHSRINWTKPHCKPTPAADRLNNTHEPLYWLTPPSTSTPYQDHVGLTAAYPTDDPTVWSVPPANGKNHAAPFPDGLVKRALELTAPKTVCPVCGTPATREFPSSWPSELEATYEKIQRLQQLLDTESDHAPEDKLSAALDRAKTRFRNRVQALSDWNSCDCDSSHRRGVIYDPFVGSGTTVDVAVEAGYSAVGSDIDPPTADGVTPTLESF